MTNHLHNGDLADDLDLGSVIAIGHVTRRRHVYWE